METTRQLFNAVVNEINSDFKNIENATKILARFYNQPNNYKYTNGYISSIWYRGKCIEQQFKCCFGAFLLKNEKLIQKINMYSITLNKEKCGIEVLGMKPEPTKDLKYTSKGAIIKVLKESCRVNNIKIGKKDKCELVAALMKC